MGAVLNLPLELRESTDGPRPPIAPLTTIRQARYAPRGSAVKGQLAFIWRPPRCSGCLDLPTLLIDRNAQDVPQPAVAWAPPAD
jgi:hypothetical protein